MLSATTSVRTIAATAATIVRHRHGRAGLILSMVLAILALPGCSSLGKRSTSSTQRPGGTAQSSTKKYKDPVNEFLATNPRVPIDGARK